MTFVEYFKVALHVDHVSSNKFCFDINWQTTQLWTFEFLVFSKIALSTKFYVGLFSIYKCLLEGNALAQKENLMTGPGNWIVLNFMLSENNFYFSNRSIFRYGIKEVSWLILRFAFEWTWTFMIFLRNVKLIIYLL